MQSTLKMKLAGRWKPGWGRIYLSCMSSEGMSWGVGDHCSGCKACFLWTSVKNMRGKETFGFAEAVTNTQELLKPVIDEAKPLLHYPSPNSQKIREKSKVALVYILWGCFATDSVWKEKASGNSGTKLGSLSNMDAFKTRELVLYWVFVWWIRMRLQANPMSLRLWWVWSFSL